MENESMPVSAQITAADLARYEQELAAYPGAEPLARAVQNTGVVEASKNFAAKQHLDHVFSVEVKTGKVTNQKQSGRCWLFATLNTLRHQLVQELNLKDFEFSQNYNAFYDRLEKANAFYERIIATADRPLNDRLVQWNLSWNDSDGGQWSNAVALIEKYGLVPKSAMEETFTSSNTAGLNTTLQWKLRRDAMFLRRMIAAGQTPAAVAEQKQAFLSEVYRMLVFAFGKPVEKFDFEYRDKDNNYHIVRNLTPQEFYAKYIKVDFDDYVCLTDAPDHELGKVYSLPSQDYIAGGRTNQFVIVDTAALKQATIAQLQAGETAWFGCDVGADSDRKAGILDPDFFKQDELFGVDLSFSKQDRLASGQGEVSHAMTMTGVDLVEDQPTKWKVENSWGDKPGQAGYFIMTDKWFDNYMYEVIINKKYLTSAQKELLHQEPIPLAPWDSLK